MASPSRVTIDQIPWSTLVYQIKAKHCTPFIGAGASYGYVPLARDLARRLLDDDERERPAAPLRDRTDLARVCQYLAVTRRMGSWPKQKIADVITALPPPDFSNPDDPHRVLADLELPVYLTTNYDDFMYSALRARNPAMRPRQEYARWTRELMEAEPSVFEDGYAPDPINPVVFHLHGHCGNPASMVASEDDYLDFLVSISKDLTTSPTGPGQQAVLPLPIRKALRSTTLLFIGYSLTDVNFRVILRGLLGSLTRGARGVSLAIQYSEDAADLERYLEEYFLWSLDLQVYWGTAADFTAKLRDEWNKR